MAQKLYRIQNFLGLNQAIDEGSLDAAYSPDCANIDTSCGRLETAKGHTKAIAALIPGRDNFLSLYVGEIGTAMCYIAITRKYIYSYDMTNISWSTLYTFTAPLVQNRVDYINATCDGEDCLLIATGETQLLKCTGTACTAFGSEELGSNHLCNYVAMYQNRLFSGGESTAPTRLCYSQPCTLAGGIENWSESTESSELSGGYIDIGPTESDPICGIKALRNQLLIFKEKSLYRLIGDRPSSFTVERLCDLNSRVAHTAFVARGDGGFFMARDGLYVYNGVNAYRSNDADHIKKILGTVNTADCRAACTSNKLVFKLDGPLLRDYCVEYDINRGCYMLRTGFMADAFCEYKGEVYMINSNRYVYLYDNSDTYDGVPIEAYWKTPCTDLGDKGEIKGLVELYIRGESNTGSSICVETYSDGKQELYTVDGLDSPQVVKDVRLNGEGRTFAVRVSNLNGGHFSICAGLELLLSCRRRVN